MESPVGNLPRQHRGTGAFTPFSVSACAEHGVAVHDRGALHPRAVLAYRRRVADDIRRAGLQDLHAAVGRELLAVLIYVEDLRLGAERFPVVGIGPTLQTAGRD